MVLLSAGRGKLGRTPGDPSRGGHAPVAGAPRLGYPGTMRLRSLPLEVANLAVVLVAPAVFLALRSRLPERVPMQFGIDGTPSRYGSPDELWVLFAIMAGCYGLLWLVTSALEAERSAPATREVEGLAVLDRQRRLGQVRATEASMLVTNLVLATVALSIAAGSLPGGEALLVYGPWMAVALAVVGLSLVLAYWLPRLSRIQAAIRGLPGASAASGRESDWRWGGLFYYAPHDPAVLVPKRIGIGLTLNFGRPAAWLFLAAAVGEPLLAVALAT